MTFEDWKKGLDHKKLTKMAINDMNVDRFLYGRSDKTLPSYPRSGYPINCNLVIKHCNRGKIESHLWFFKGFCTYLNPDFC